jgi:hypothetical protein
VERTGYPNLIFQDPCLLLPHLSQHQRRHTDGNQSFLSPTPSLAQLTQCTLGHNLSFTRFRSGNNYHCGHPSSELQRLERW